LASHLSKYICEIVQPAQHLSAALLLLHHLHVELQTPLVFCAGTHIVEDVAAAVEETIPHPSLRHSSITNIIY
jgi:hypothetical protein